ncbi:MAG: ABC transporter permease [Gammaproteobacteria bacterium]|nr:ABC transporter permease [Gammaproteobacteria bacterium]
MSSPIITIATYTFIEAVRNRMLWLVLALFVCAFTFAEFIASVAITESQAFSIALLSAFLRICMVLMIAFFVVSTVLREFHDKGFQLILSLPIPRSSYLLGKCAGFSVLALLIAVGCGAVVSVYVPFGQAAIWTISLWFELLIVVGFCLLCLLTFNQVTGALCAVVLFYFVSRSIETLVLMTDGPFSQSPTVGQTFIDGFVRLLSFVLPNLDAYSRTEWLVYHTGEWSALVNLAVGAAVYLALLLGAAMFDLYRKNF